jgi:hypothetical protein
LFEGRYRIRNDSGQDCGGVDSEGIRGKVVEEPDDGDGDETGPIKLDDEPVRDFGVAHATLRISISFFHLDSEIED